MEKKSYEWCSAAASQILIYKCKQRTSPPFLQVVPFAVFTKRRKREDNTKKKKITPQFLCIFRNVSWGMCLISMDELPLTFSLFLKLTQCNKWDFHSFLGNTGSFHYIFLSTPWIRCALYSTVGIIWIDWMLTFRCCSLWCKCCGRDSKGHYSQSIHTCLLHAGLQIGWRG